MKKKFELFVCYPDIKTKNDDLVNRSEFKCAFNKGYFKDTDNGNCYEYKSDYYHTATVIYCQEDESYYVMKIGNKSYGSLDSALRNL